MKKTFIYIFSLLLSLPYLYSCSDEQMPELLPIEDEGNSTVVEDDIDVSLLEPGFNLNPKDQSGNLPDADQPLDIYFNANGLKVETEKGEDDSPLLGYDKDCYLHAGVISEGTWMYVPAGWDEDTEKCKMKLVKENVWKITLGPSIRDWFGSGSTPVEQLGLIIRTSDGEKGEPADHFEDVIDNKYVGFIPAEPEIEDMPAGLQHGINIIDNSTVALVLYEKDNQGKRNYDYAYVMGDFNNWKRANDETSQMFYDETAGCWWIILNGLDANKEYAFQYYLGIRSEVEGKKDTELRLADPYTEKILDAGSDPYIPESTYPSSQMVYPSKGAGVVSTFKINKDEYPWEYDDYRIKNKNSLVIYELLLRDFSETKDLNGAIQKLDYLSELGVTAIELLPVQEFEGNSSWGYNPCFYFAMDKAYGTKNMYKKFIDECHKRNMAVILDVVYNHATGAHPFARLYWNSEKNCTASNNPWFNEANPHPSVGNFFEDFNHTEPMVRKYIKRNLEFLIDEYHFDGFRFDLTRGFSQKDAGYDNERINILKDYYNIIKSKRKDAIMICEHWCDVEEENVLALAGMMCWNRVNDSYYQAGMGMQSGSGFEGMFWKGSYDVTKGGWVSYIESHDEERAAFKAKEWGTDIIRNDIQVRMNSMAALAAFTFTVPGPKMIWQGGELGFDTALLNYAGTTNEEMEKGKTDEKPIDWTYFNNPARKSLHQAYSRILNLRKGNPELFDERAIIKVRNVNEGSWTGGRRLEIETYNGKKMVVIGFFADTADTQWQQVPEGWPLYYDVISGRTENSSIGGENVVVDGGHSFKIYTNFVPTNN